LRRTRRVPTSLAKTSRWLKVKVPGWPDSEDRWKQVRLTGRAVIEEGVKIVTSKIEKERTKILERINKKGRRLEKQFPIDASELNAQLRKVIEWIALRLRK
jgi:hypothetical protein